MARKLSLPHERRKAQLQSKQLSLRVQIADRKEKLESVRAELKAMTPPKKTPPII